MLSSVVAASLWHIFHLDSVKNGRPNWPDPPPPSSHLHLSAFSWPPSPSSSEDVIYGCPLTKLCLSLWINKLNLVELGTKLQTWHGRCEPKEMIPRRPQSGRDTRALSLSLSLSPHFSFLPRRRTPIFTSYKSGDGKAGGRGFWGGMVWKMTWKMVWHLAWNSLHWEKWVVSTC